MSAITNKVMELYNKYPWPLPEANTDWDFNDMGGLLVQYINEFSLTLAGKKMLDAGCGTGHNITMTSPSYPDTQFTAVDYCKTSLGIAKGLAKKRNNKNIKFHHGNLMEDLSHFGRFDLVYSCGVLVCVEDPHVAIKNLANVVKDDGAVMLWLYGAPGDHLRFTRKKIITTLMGLDREDYELGIQLVDALGFEVPALWNLEGMSEKERKSQIVDAYLHIHEYFFTSEMIDAMMRESDLYAYTILGINPENVGGYVAVDLSLNSLRGIKNNDEVTEWTDFNKFLKTELLRDRYGRLSVFEKYKLLDEFFLPSGYVVVGLTKGFVDNLPSDFDKRNRLVYLQDHDEEERDLEDRIHALEIENKELKALTLSQQEKLDAILNTLK